jgi:hypothetical protein
MNHRCETTSKPRIEVGCVIVDLPTPGQVAGTMIYRALTCGFGASAGLEPAAYGLEVDPWPSIPCCLVVSALLRLGASSNGYGPVIQCGAWRNDRENDRRRSPGAWKPGAPRPAAARSAPGRVAGLAGTGLHPLPELPLGTGATALCWSSPNPGAVQFW